MKLIEYLKDRIVFLTINAILFFITYITLAATNTSKQIIFLAFILWFGPLVTYMILDFIRQKNYYEKVIGICDHLDKKYLLSEVIDKPKYLNEKIVYDLLRESNRSMRDNINYYKNMQNDYKEYIETWVHEIKTPISSTMLFIENNSDIIPQHIKSEIQKIEDYVEQVLYYSRSSDVNKDYIIKKFNIEDIVRKVIRKNARDCINKKIAINVENIDNIIYSDPKWVEFIINQIMINSIKYSKNKNAIIDISSVSNDNNIVLTIKDNGVGIDEKDVFRVFEKGFTGENGRKYSKSTGIGLYLCKKLCNKLGLNINLTSNKDMGTTVNIVFPINSDIFR
ncbi:integral membrane sensor signal transduction histidine kinase [[Clostridium] sordellii]|uniref:sensor histidine kinase n=1 Tax=Paraclostridium sordellii TaxID=1505 RepID=UPI0005E505AE|nr:sensor histidine kinase [Paeniclostridium sordellii]CEQ20505.1 integral membrane sensor signal transduction histidine kinase [[Clostridium] sordellii] [Paeniclostridium sordellii]